METILVRTVYQLQITNRSTSLRVFHWWIVQAIFEIHSQNPCQMSLRSPVKSIILVLGFIVIVIFFTGHQTLHSDAMPLVSSWSYPSYRRQIEGIIIIMTETVTCSFMIDVITIAPWCRSRVAFKQQHSWALVSRRHAFINSRWLSQNNRDGQWGSSPLWLWWMWAMILV
jgi:hypothetical protein